MNSRNIVIITGSSRGLGKSLALSFAKSITNPLDLVLVGRSTNDLAATKNLIIENRNNLETTCKIIEADLSDLSSLPQTSELIFAQNPQHNYSNAYFLNNAGSLGRLSHIGSSDDLIDFTSAINFNITSSCYLTSEFVRRLSGLHNIEKAVVVNISSLCAIKPFPSWGIYCAGKAAREMYHQVLAQENSKNHKLRVLNYSPGPLDTEMQRQIREGENVDKEIQAIYRDMYMNNVLVDPQVSADKCLALLLSDSYESGAHIDYYNVKADGSLDL